MKRFSKAWKGSKKPRKQRKYRLKAPLHIRKNFISVHLSKDLKKKYGKRSLPARTGDKVKVMKGNFKKKEGRIERVERTRAKIFITGIELNKKDGSKMLQAIDPSNLMIIDLNLDDKKRKDKLEKHNKAKPSVSQKSEKQGFSGAQNSKNFEQPEVSEK